MNIKTLKRLEANARATQLSKPVGRKSSLTPEIIEVVKILRSKELSFSSIFQALKEEGMIKYKSFHTFYQAVKVKLTLDAPQN